MEVPQSTGFEDLPFLVLEELAVFLSYGSRRACRLVSRNLKLHVDEIGLSVKIDSRKSTSIDLCNTVRVTEAQFLHLKQTENLDLGSLELGSLKTAILTGFIESNWILNDLPRKAPNLRVLIIGGRCLIAEDIGKASDSEPQMPIFEHLTELQIFLTEGASRAASRCAFKQLEGDNDNQNFGNKPYTTIQNNMTHLLKAIRSQALKMLCISISERSNVSERDEDKERPFRWELKPLYEFIEKHSETLEVILIPDGLSAGIPLQNLHYKVPNHLKLFSLNAALKTTYKPGTYWWNVLDSQRSLQKLDLHHSRAPGQELIPLLKSVLVNNAQTLIRVYLEISTTYSPNLQSLDMNVFQHSVCLQSLIIVGYQGPPLFIKNLNKLERARLKSLKLYGRTTNDFNGVQFMQNFSPSNFLLTVSMKTCPSDTKAMGEFIRLVLRCRTLNELAIKMEYNPESYRLWKLPEYANGNEIGLELWFANLRAGKPLNHCCTGIRMSETDDITRRDLINASGAAHSPYAKYPSASKYYDYMDLISRSKMGMCKTREQPFHIPINLDSYTMWWNWNTKTCCVQPNTNKACIKKDNIEQRVSVSMSDSS